MAETYGERPETYRDPAETYGDPPEAYGDPAEAYGEGPGVYEVPEADDTLGIPVVGAAGSDAPGELPEGRGAYSLPPAGSHDSQELPLVPPYVRAQLPQDHAFRPERAEGQNAFRPERAEEQVPEARAAHDEPGGQELVPRPATPAVPYTAAPGPRRAGCRERRPAAGSQGRGDRRLPRRCPRRRPGHRGPSPGARERPREPLEGAPGHGGRRHRHPPRTAPDPGTDPGPHTGTGTGTGTGFGALPGTRDTDTPSRAPPPPAPPPPASPARG
ncbi:hypothetical protein Smic_50160 [Streptomyces microflavus]|uniref:Uncharacterized protein n=1 Tax=Streptomyces microflavus TaxID=1919 RepID=A0A7J0CV90_STRMI|nr:hypothetical protein Smic_50160 [Streptomyces microflavus]